MKLLFLGGTQFVGRHMVQQALTDGHEVTLFQRGKTNPKLWDDRVTQVLGDRKASLAGLQGQTFDAVIDVCGYFPQDLELACNALKGQVGRYIFVSTISVYSGTKANQLHEGGPVHNPPATLESEITGENYGPLKVACERVVEKAFGNKSLIIRPGLVVGPYDHTDRFSFWPWRIKTEPYMIAPMPKSAQIQVIDARDLAHFTILMAQRQGVGAYNVTGPAIKWQDLIAACCRQIPVPAQILWASPSILRKLGVEPGTDLPLWVPLSEDTEIMSRVNTDRARSMNLKTRQIDDTISALLKEMDERPQPLQLKAGISTDRLHGVIKAVSDDM
ncbi:MAG: hypothetical protein JST40_01000 [Armatimonadetes bacterium]|nr:hypothetical protein [Armatimonadota bacterium]